jgi:hypothetical protein
MLALWDRNRRAVHASCCFPLAVAVLAAGIIVGVPSTSSAQVVMNPAKAQVSYYLQASLEQRNNTTKYYTATDALDTNNPYNNPIQLSRSLGGTNGGGTGASSFSVSASLTGAAGLMRAKIDGAASASWNADSIRSNALISNTSAIVSWEDFYYLVGNPADPKPNRPLLVNTFLNLSGVMDIDVVPDATAPLLSYIAGGSVIMTLTGRDEYGRNLLGASPYGGSLYARAIKGTRTTTPVYDPPPGSIPVTLWAEEGRVGFMKFAMELRVHSASARNDDYYRPGSTSMTFAHDFSHTLAWGGITSVVDAATGEPLSEWSIVSSSGINYANPIPEPSAATLLLLASVLVCRRSIGRRRTSATSPRLARASAR